MSPTGIACRTIEGAQYSMRQPANSQRRAEKFFYNQILHQLKDQFLEFMNDRFSAQFLNDKTKKLVDDLINNIGNVRLDKLNSIRFFIEHEDIFDNITDVLQGLPQKDRINAVLGSSDMSRKYSIALTFRPPGAERMAGKQLENDPVTVSVIMDVFMRWLDFIRQREQSLAGILRELEKIEINAIEQYSCLPDTIRDITLNLKTYGELRVILEDTMNKTLSQNDMKPSAKRWFWEKVIVQGVELLNDFCHDERCPSQGCTKVHDLAITKTAEILAILYPHRYNCAPDLIASEIKEFYFRIRYPRKGEDSFIRNLFSRYADEEKRMA